MEINGIDCTDDWREEMSKMSQIRNIPRVRTAGAIVVAGILALVFTAPAEGIDLSGKGSSFSLNLDITLSYGATYRMEDRDPAIYSHFEGGTAWSGNGDDGNLNFDKGIVSNTPKATIDFSFASNPNKSHQFGFFVRGSAFYDYALMQDCCERTELTDEALDWAGNRTELLDAYGWWQFPGGEIRVGRQVLNWGESTFIQGGLSVINSLDVSAIRVPGAELREAFRPQGMVWGSFNLSQNFSVEGFYQYEWEPTVIDPPGTYFSTNDFAGPGGEHVFLAFDSFADTGEPPVFIPPDMAAAMDHPFMSVPRGDTREAEDGGQYGVAFRLFVPSWGGTEFGFYYVNYHSRLPTINGVTGPITILPELQALQVPVALWSYYILGVPPGVDPVVDATVTQFVTAAATSVYANSANWYTAYPEDIKLYGLSWNAQLGTSGIAFQGEVSYRQDNPLQMDDVEVLFAALSPISAGLAAVNQVAPGGVGFSEEIEGSRRFDTSQLQFTLTKIFSNFLGADQGVILGEFGFHKVFDMPSKDELRFEGPGTYTSGNPLMSLPGGAHAGKPFEEPEHFADDFSWGYRLVSRLTYNNAIGAWSLSPRISWQQDVSGVTPGPGGSFIDGLTALSVGLSFDYQNAWQVDFSYTMYDGADRWNLINDRDFLGGFIKFSF
jgi:hypothetical protein